MMAWPPRLKTGWWTFSLPGFRDQPYPTNYSLFSYETLPPITAPTDQNFTWLLSEPSRAEWSLAIIGHPYGSLAELSQLPDLISQAQVNIPPVFVEFMQTVSLHERIRSCNACFLELNQHMVYVTKPVNGILLHFLSDQANGLYWYRYVSELGDHSVIVSEEIFGLYFEPDEERSDQVDLTKD